MNAPPRRWLILYQYIAGLCDTGTGLLLIVAPAWTLRLMGLTIIPQPVVFVRYIGVFVLSVGLTYLWAAARWPLTSHAHIGWSTQWKITALVRTLVAVFVVVANRIVRPGDPLDQRRTLRWRIRDDSVDRPAQRMARTCRLNRAHDGRRCPAHLRRLARRSPRRQYLCLLPHLCAIRISQAPGRTWHHGEFTAPDHGRDGHRRRRHEPVCSALPPVDLSQLPAPDRLYRLRTDHRVDAAAAQCLHRRCRCPDDRSIARPAYGDPGCQSSPVDRDPSAASQSRPRHRHRIFPLQFSAAVYRRVLNGLH